MNVKLFCHSLVSDWNHGNAHFLRGVARELIRRGHDVEALEPEGSWSRTQLVRDSGPQAVEEFHAAFPELRVREYDLERLDLEHALEGAELVIVHDWNEPELVAALGEHRARHRGYVLLFYDAHHRAVSAPEQLARFDLRSYDAVLAFGSVIRDRYLDEGWTRRAFTWHEAADTELFRPESNGQRGGDLVWIGNWGDGERGEELREFLLAPAHQLGLRGTVHGVRYPAPARQALASAGLSYAGWLPNHRVPQVFARHGLTIHVPRRAYTRLIPGVPTIRVFEALACGIPLICAPWEDREGLFRPGQDYLVARSGREMADRIRMLLENGEAARQLAANGLETLRARHTCAHRVDELMDIVQEVG